ncbi:MAG TPA: hypothetical protein VHT75_14025 [Acidimicrobiales bacterium]|jgi:hypothetical protein|nr:hypothetical protein [Acidimicrobiales bacterium]
MSVKYRIMAALGALVLIATAVVTSSAAGGASTQGRVSDIINFSGSFVTVVAPTATKPGWAKSTSKTCLLVSDGESNFFKCSASGAGVLTTTGGTLTGMVASLDGVINFRETFTFTSATTGTGSGTVSEYDFDGKCTTRGTVATTFTTSSTGSPNMLNQTTHMVITDDAITPGSCDTDNTFPPTTPPSTPAGV